MLLHLMHLLCGLTTSVTIIWYGQVARGGGEENLVELVHVNYGAVLIVGFQQSDCLGLRNI